MSMNQGGLGEEFDGVVRLFPLPEMVLFPSTMAPLHIFESRYREMFEDAIRGDQLLAMATLLPGHEYDYYSRGPIANAICIGRIAEHKKTDQGTYLFNLIGMQRAEVVNEVEPVRSFRRANVNLLEDAAPVEEASELAAGARLADQIKIFFPSAAELTEHYTSGEIPLAAFSDILAFYLPLDVDAKLRLLGEPQPLNRVQRLLDELPKLGERKSEERRPEDPGDPRRPPLGRN